MNFAPAAPGSYEAFRQPGVLAGYERLPENIRELADKNYALLKREPKHPSLHFKQIGRYRSVRAGLHYRALGVGADEGVL